MNEVFILKTQLRHSDIWYSIVCYTLTLLLLFLLLQIVIHCALFVCAPLLPPDQNTTIQLGC